MNFLENPSRVELNNDNNECSVTNIPGHAVPMYTKKLDNIYYT